VLHKEGSPRTGQIAEVLANDPPARLLADDSPDQDILLPALGLGAYGIANASGNVFPAELARLATPWTVSEIPEGFRDLYFRLVPLIKFMYSFRSPIGVKMLMKLLGLPAGHLRQPLDFPGTEQHDQGLELLRSILGERDFAETSAKVTTG
jgi:4-hydroxy-tetrahydrodipicolinate synthase